MSNGKENFVSKVIHLGIEGIRKLGSSEKRTNTSQGSGAVAGSIGGGGGYGGSKSKKHGKKQTSGGKGGGK